MGLKELNFLERRDMLKPINLIVGFCLVPYIAMIQQIHSNFENNKQMYYINC